MVASDPSPDPAYVSKQGCRGLALPRDSRQRIKSLLGQEMM